jgi:hypothetical protein
MEVSGQLHALAAISPGKEHLVPIDRRLGEPQSQSGHSVKEKKSQPLPGILIVLVEYFVLKTCNTMVVLF